MNHDDPRHRSPPRAEPLQPDRPGQGTDRQKGGSGTAPAKGEQGDLSRFDAIVAGRGLRSQGTRLLL